MNIKIYPNPSSSSRDGSYSSDDIRRGVHWVNADVTCPHCGKLQPMAATHYLGGPCVRCGKLTSGEQGG